MTDATLDSLRRVEQDVLALRARIAALNVVIADQRAAPCWSLEYLGSPFAARWSAPYPRTIWDMEVVGGRIYLGCGNSSNRAPNANAGDVPLVYYDLEAGVFVTLATLQEEQIEHFVRLADGRTLIPGHDPRGGGKGKIYDAATGEVAYSLGMGEHVYDVAEHEGLIYAAIDAAPDELAVLDAGKWRTLPTPLYPPLPGTIKRRAEASRNYAFFTVAGALYASYDMWSWESNRYFVNYYRVFPDRIELATGGLSTPRINRFAAFGNRTLAIGGGSVNDMQFQPTSALVFEGGVLQPSEIGLNSTPYDVLRDGDRAYLLTNKPLADTMFRISVWESDDLNRFTPVLSFDAAALARSFAKVGDDFYFGFGSGTGKPVNAAQTPAGGDGLSLLTASGQVWRART